MLGEQADMVCRPQDALQDGSSLFHASQAGEGLGDPEGANDERAFRLSEIVVPHVPVEESRLFAAMPEREFTGDVQHRRLAQGVVRITEDGQLSQRGVETGVGRAVPNGSLADGAEQGVFRLDTSGCEAD